MSLYRLVYSLLHAVSMVGGAGIEPALTALSGRCLVVYKATPKANISNPPEKGLLYCWLRDLESNQGLELMRLLRCRFSIPR